MDLQTTIDILKFVVPMIIGAIVYLVRWGQRIEQAMAAHKSENKLSFQGHDLRLLAVEELTKYLVEAGKNLKEQQNSMAMSINSINISIVEMNKNIEKIILKLDKYDQGITQFYRDFDLKHKETTDK